MQDIHELTSSALEVSDYSMVGDIISVSNNLF